MDLQKDKTLQEIFCNINKIRAIISLLSLADVEGITPDVLSWNCEIIKNMADKIEKDLESI